MKFYQKIIILASLSLSLGTLAGCSENETAEIASDVFCLQLEQNDSVTLLESVEQTIRGCINGANYIKSSSEVHDIADSVIVVDIRLPEFTTQMLEYNKAGKLQIMCCASSKYSADNTSITKSSFRVYLSETKSFFGHNYSHQRHALLFDLDVQPKVAPLCCFCINSDNTIKFVDYTTKTALGTQAVYLSELEPAHEYLLIYQLINQE